MKKYTLLLIMLLTWCQAVFAGSFYVKQIDFQGLQRISPATAESYLPIKRGQRLTADKTSAVIKALYKTGFFEHIALSQQGNTLIIHVEERPTIGQLKISGNSVIATDKLTAVMRNLDIAEGRIYNAATLDRIKQGLLSQYYQLGRYNASVDITTTPMSRNRVFVKIKISEGLVARIRRITIIGNHAFTEAQLTKQLTVSTPGILTFFTQTDRYSEEKLEESSEKLRNFYLDHGYLHFTVKSAQAEVTPDRKAVYVIIVVDEGPVFYIKGYALKGDNLPVAKTELEQKIKIKSGDVFSRQKIIESEKGISNVLGDNGYVFANVSLRPDIDEKKKEVFLEFNVIPGKRAYVRNITFSENSRTNDVVLRREITQFEAAPVSTSKLDDSKHRLNLLPYIKEVEMSIKPVPEKDDQVDVNYKVKEDSSAQASFKVGYSQIQRFIVGAGLNQKNFLGTGETLGINFTRSLYEQYYGIDFTDPYYTVDGISRSFNLAYSRVDPGAASVSNGYTTNSFQGGVLFGIPLGQEKGAFSRFVIGADYQNTIVHLQTKNGVNLASQEVLNFVDNHGRHFQELDIKTGLTRDSRDRAIFPTRGSLNTLFLDTFAPLDSNSLAFYMFNYHGKYYFPLTNSLITLTRADFGYGNGFGGINDYPFFKNYYAGGIDSVRGYHYGLGPLDSRGNPYGGNMLVDASVALIFPNYLSENIRTSAFFDIGNVYSSLNNKKYSSGAESGPLRSSVGIEVDWYTPFGPLALSLAKPLNPHHKETEPFQFSIGANF